MEPKTTGSEIDPTPQPSTLTHPSETQPWDDPDPTNIQSIEAFLSRLDQDFQQAKRDSHGFGDNSREELSQRLSKEE